jgi:hypothetical protein
MSRAWIQSCGAGAFNFNFAIAEQSRGSSASRLLTVSSRMRPGQAAWLGAALALLNIMAGVIAQFVALGRYNTRYFNS